MTNRALIYIVKDKTPLTISGEETVRSACRAMLKTAAGAVLVVDDRNRLEGIFTGRDAVRLLAKGADPAAMLLSKAMTRKPVTVTTTARAVDALLAMDQGGFRHVPVVDEGQIRGVVSRNDFKGMEFAEFLRRSTGSQTRQDASRDIASIIANREPVVCKTDQTVQQAAAAMRQRNSGAALVIDGRRRLKGIFTGRDAVRLLGRSKNPAAAVLSRAMRRDPSAVTRTCTAIDALHIMNDGGFRHLPVVEDGRVLGIVTRRDFTAVEIDQLDQEEHLKECIW